MRKDANTMLTLTPPAYRPVLRQTLRFALAAALLGGLFGLAPYAVGQAGAAEASHVRIAGNAYGATRQLEVTLGKSMIIDLPGDAREVIVSQPTIAGAIMRSKRRVIIQGLSPGSTNIFFLDGAGEAIAVLDLEIRKEPSQVGGALEAALARILPGSAIRVESVTLNGDVNRVVLSGEAQSSDDVARAGQVAAQFAGGEGNVANLITVGGAQQVMLRVTVAEVNREAAKQMGINLSVDASVAGMTTSLLNNRGLDEGSVAALGGPGRIDVGGSVGPFSIEASLRALESRNAVRLLAEPMLTALSGEEADFLVGGEFPIQTRDPETETITTTFKDFGVKLGFTPTVRSNGTIGLEVSTEVSEIVSQLGQLSVRRANTTVELSAGATLAIGGLLQESTRQQITKMPFLGDVPILGALFRSRDYVRSRTELLVLVTPYLAQPGPAPELPTDRITFAGDAEAVFLGHIESMYAVGSGGMRGGYKGSVGFEFD